MDSTVPSNLPLFFTIMPELIINSRFHQNPVYSTPRFRINTWAYRTGERKTGITKCMIAIKS
jgi:hypothetical protein